MASVPDIRRASAGRALSIVLLVMFGWVGMAEAGQVCFYEKSHYRKKSWCFDFDPNGPPQFGAKDFGTLISANNEVGSIKITGSGFPGMWIYDGRFDGKSRLITGSTGDLGNMNNEMSSWVVRNKGGSSTKVRIYVRKVHYDGDDPDGAGKPDHMLFSRVWQGNAIRWKAMIGSKSALARFNAWSGYPDKNYKKDTNHWIPAVVQEWTHELGHDKQITLAGWDCAGTCILAKLPNTWQQPPPCATGQCTQQSGATTYPLGDMVLDLTKHQAGQTVTLSNGPMTAEVEIWKNPYYGQNHSNQRSPDRVSIVGSTNSYSQAQFGDYVAGMKFTDNPDNEPAYALVGGAGVGSLVPGQCTVVYPNARAGGNKANVDIGELTCVVELADGVTVSATPVYGGCNIAARGGGSEASCSIGVFRAALRVEHAIPGCGEQICNFSEELTVSGPNASACNTMTYDSYCQSAEAELVSAEVKVTDGHGNGVGAGVSIGVGVGAGATVQDGVFQTSIDLKLGLGAELSFSIGYERNAKALYRLGERGVMYLANNREAMGKRFADVHRTVFGKSGVKAFAGLAKIRRQGSTIRFAKDAAGAVVNFATGFSQGTWKSASNFFNSATSWIPKF